jgi:hypothetical protein
MKQIVNMGRISVGRRLILLPMLTIPMSILSRLQMICGNNNRNYESDSFTRFALDPCSEDEFGKPICFRLLLAVALLSSMDSDLEAFSHNPTDGSFTALAGQLTVFTNYLDQRFLSY